jgi:serralysin
VAFDTDGDAGQAYRLYQAAFNRTPDQAGLGYHIHNLDRGMTLHDVAQAFVSSNEFKFTYGPLNNTQFATQLYANVLHRAPDAAGLAYHVANLDAGASRADVLIGFSESSENQAALIGVISSGMVFTG